MACAARLRAAGVRPGQTVILQAPADGASTEVLAALWHAGAVPVPVTVTATPDEVVHIARSTGARTAVITPTWRDRDLATALAACAADAGLQRVIVLGDDGPAGTVALASLETAGEPTIGHLDPNAMACILFTSGSTAEPKGVRHSHETLLCGLSTSPTDPASVMLATFPAGHVASLMALLRPLSCGGTSVVMDRWSARAAAALIEEFGVTVSAGTPFFLSTLLDEAERTGRDISSLRGFLVGAAAVPPPLVARSESAGITTWRTYGSTEHPAVSTGSPLDPPDKRSGTDGRVAPGNEVRVLGEDGADLALGAEGEIVSRGPKQFLGYQNPADDAEAFIDQTWFRTGDLGRLDPDGYLVVTDRVKDIIIRGGENISAREVEEALARHPAVGEVAVCALPDRTWGESVCAVVVPRPGRIAPTLDELATAAIVAGLAPHKAPSKVVLAAELPRTSAGKVRKRDLRPLIG
jgi:acyl-CoA synthetase (AMP-forming)/AMP-acid ligase II